MSELEKIVEVKELFSKDKVNDLLKDGWVLLAQPAPSVGEHETNFLYTLGKPKSES